jgi:hypothetical protein
MISVPLIISRIDSVSAALRGRKKQLRDGHREKAVHHQVEPFERVADRRGDHRAP